MDSDEVDVLSSFARRRRSHFAIRVAWFVTGIFYMFAGDLDRETVRTIVGTTAVALLTLHYLTWACPRCVKSFSFIGDSIRFCPHCGVILRAHRHAAVAPSP